MSKTYEEMIRDQIAEISKGLPKGRNPLSWPYIEGALWCLPFAEKPAKPLPENTFTLQLVDKTLFKVLHVSRPVRAIDIEREIVTSQEGLEILVERVYFVRHTILKTRRDLGVINTLWKGTGDNFSLSSQCHEAFVAMGSLSVPNVSLRNFLDAPLPITISSCTKA